LGRIDAVIQVTHSGDSVRPKTLASKIQKSFDYNVM